MRRVNNHRRQAAHVRAAPRPHPANGCHDPLACESCQEQSWDKLFPAPDRARELDGKEAA